ncbi:MAG: hypothetical protein SFX73_30405 [Kofleriaceae bacterium]|nr:hypothetical protein [Kofleriaceae bacterium]
MATLTTLLSLVLMTACGAVTQLEEPSPPPTGALPTETGDLEAGIDPNGRSQPIAEAPLLFDVPQAATTSASLFRMSVRDHARRVSLIGSGAEPQIDVLEQRIVTKDAAPVDLMIDVAPPAGTFSRVIASDVIRAQYAVAERVLCESNGFGTFDPRCESATPVASTSPSAGTISASRWRLWVMDEQTGAAITGCSVLGTHLACTLPARAAATYRIVVSVDGLSELWGAPAMPGVRTLDGATFTGATERQHQCWDWEHTATATYCRTRWDFTRYTAVDRVGIELEPLRLTIGADDFVSADDSPALTWDSGDADLPGGTY